MDHQELYVATCCVLTLTFGIVLWRRNKRGRKLNLPPGPPTLPLIGNIHQLTSPLLLSNDKFFKKYGHICHLKFGERSFVVLSSLKTMKTAFSQEQLTGRMRTIFEESLVRNSGIALIDGDTWKFNRRLSLQILRDFGFGKCLSQEIIHREAGEMCKYLDSISTRSSCLINTSIVFGITTMNVISSILLGERSEYENSESIEFLKMIHYVSNESSFFETLTVMFPSMNVFSGLFQFTAKMKTFKMAHEIIIKKLESLRQRMQGNEITEAENFVEAYYLAQKQHEDKTGNKTAHREFSEWQIVRTVLDLYMAGMDTTSTALSWTVVLLSLHEPVRQKMVEEVHQVIGRDKIVSVEDRKLFHYSLAVIDEVLRFSSLAPIGVPHRAMVDTKIEGYDIEVDSVIIPNLYSLHHDSQIWEKPDEFYPQHFLSEDGATYRPREHLIPFGIGRRVCLGESLARMETFIFIITLVQRYEFRLNFDENKGENLSKILLGTEGIIRAPGSHTIEIIKMK